MISLAGNLYGEKIDIKPLVFFSKLQTLAYLLVSNPLSADINCCAFVQKIIPLVVQVYNKPQALVAQELVSPPHILVHP
jgi:hypothetical protein